MQRYRLTIAYDGTDFCGWQKQEPPEPERSPGAPPPPRELILEGHEATQPGRVVLRTVQAVVERAVREAVREPITLLGASRTDSGVHARGQVGAFTAGWTTTGGWPLERGVEPLRRAINSRLPGDVIVTRVEAAEPGFDPIGGAVRKCYTYTIFCGPDRPLWRRRTATFVREALDVEAMNRAAGAMVGEFDFAAFAASGHGRLSTVRRVDSCAVETCDEQADRGHLIRITVTGGGFLYNQVRIMAGTLVEAGRGRLDPALVPEIIASRDRSRAGPTMKPEGLCLEWIRYAGE